MQILNIQLFKIGIVVMNMELEGVYNFVTKRGLCIGKNSNISWTQVETGSSITWKYPSCMLVGENSKGEFYSVALTNNYQQADTGTKMIHLGEKTKVKLSQKVFLVDLLKTHIEV